LEDASLRRAAYLRGVEAEAWIADRLERQGWLVLDRNWRGGGGELDLVARRGEQLRFVEVKARLPEDESGSEAVDEGKQRRLVRAAEAWLQEHGSTGDMAFLVALVSMMPEVEWSVEWIDDAFDGG